jgi:outer membrane protein assembly factor BamB
MSSAPANDITSSDPTTVVPSSTPKPIRVWVLLALTITGLICMLVPSLLGMDDSFRFPVLAFGGLLHLLMLGVWVLALSRAPWRDRWLFLVLGVVTFGVICLAQDRSLGILIVLYGTTIALGCLTIALIVSRQIDWRSRKWIAYVAWALPLLCWLVLGSDGMEASFAPELRWRWSPNAEARALMAKKKDTIRSAGKVVRSVTLREGDWPRFRGSQSDGLASDQGLDLNDSIQSKLVWKQPIGPAWSSVIVVDGLLYTQEQRGDNEAVVCMEAATGAEVWSYSYPARFVDQTQVSGVGPRSTPTFANGKIYTVGGTGIVTCLDAASGEFVWKRNLSEDCGTPVAMWGFSTSATLQGDRCYLLGGGNKPNSKDSICYDAESGEIQWSASGSGETYSSPQLVTLCDEEQIIVSVGSAVIGRSAADGTERWRISAGIGNMSLMPLLFRKDQLLVPSGDGDGSCLVEVKHIQEDWQVNKQWTSSRLRPDFNDVVVVDELVLGLTKGMLTCVDSSDGKLLWKKFRFGSGQVIGLPSHRAVMVISEQGEINLIRVSTKEPTVIHAWPAVTGKTWNHPVLVGNRVYCRSTEEIACYELK